MTTQEENKEEVIIKLKKALLATDLYLTKKEEKYILFRIPFTVYFLWKDIRYNKYRLVVKEPLNSNNKDKELYTYKYKII